MGKYSTAPVEVLRRCAALTAADADKRGVVRTLWLRPLTPCNRSGGVEARGHVREDRGPTDKTDRPPRVRKAKGARAKQEPAEAVPSNTIFVGNLPWDVDSAQLATFFPGRESLTADDAPPAHAPA